VKKILFIALSLVFTPSAHASVHKSHARSVRNLVLWCGSASGAEREKFPYLAAIKNYRTRRGVPVQVATVYKNKRVVLRQYVYRSEGVNQLAYESSGDSFSLSFKNHPGASGYADFHAVINDEDGTKLIGNGLMPCYVQSHVSGNKLQSSAGRRSVHKNS
jgi:hypothetical protein